jgi:hypothetical protein
VNGPLGGAILKPRPLAEVDYFACEISPGDRTCSELFVAGCWAGSYQTFSKPLINPESIREIPSS